MHPVDLQNLMTKAGGHFRLSATLIKRARQLIAGEPALLDSGMESVVGTAIQEVDAGLVSLKMKESEPKESGSA